MEGQNEREDFISDVQPEQTIREQTKTVQFVLNPNVNVKEKEILLNDLPFKWYDKEDLKNVESKLKKMIYEKKKTSCIDKMMMFTCQADKVVKVVFEILKQMENK